LRLNDNQLTGSIPQEIGNLTGLTTLWLSNNQLTGSIPPEIGNLTNLTYLNLSYNQLTGSIPPEIGNLTNLTDLRLHDNQLKGEIPESICELTNLIWYLSNLVQPMVWYTISSIENNQLCPPYPSCIEDEVGTQYTSGCD
jgi:Leucine-rich repeat (LRR) protein